MPRMRPETKSRKLEFYGNQLKHLQEKSRSHPHDRKIRGAIVRLMDKLEKIRENPRDIPSEHTAKELERQRQVGEDIKKEKEKPRGLSFYDNKS